MTDHALYRHYDTNGRLLYVGITNDPGQRWKGHRDKAWWHEVTNTTIERFPDRATVLTAERKAIETEKPWWNIQGNGDIVAYRKRVEAAAAEHLDNTYYRGVLLAGLQPDALQGMRTAFRCTIKAHINHQRGQLDERGLRNEFLVLDEQIIQLDKASDLEPGAVYDWGQIGSGEAFRFIEICEMNSVQIEDAYDEYHLAAEGEVL